MVPKKALTGVNFAEMVHPSISRDSSIKQDEDLPPSVYSLAEERLWSPLVFSLLKRASPHIITFTILSALGEHGARDHRLIFWITNCTLKFLPSRVSTVAKLSSATYTATSPKHSSLSLHAKRLFRLRFILGWTHHPVLVLLLLVFQELDILR